LHHFRLLAVHGTGAREGVEVVASLAIRADDALPLVSLDGELDAAGVEVASAALMDALVRHGRLVVDLARLRFLDCAGLGLLVGVHLEAQRRRLPFVLARPSPPVRRLFAVASGVDLLQVYGELAEALDAVGVPPGTTEPGTGKEGQGGKGQGWTSGRHRNSWRLPPRSSVSPTRSFVRSMS
jgi:anti-sigma B factor antagonist